MKRLFIDSPKIVEGLITCQQFRLRELYRCQKKSKQQDAKWGEKYS